MISAPAPLDPSAVRVRPRDRLTVYAQQEGIVNVYSGETSGREFIDQARAMLTDEDIARATEIGRKLTIKEALDLARNTEVASPL